MGKVKLGLFLELFRRVEGRPYLLGAKVKRDADSHDIKKIDCSGLSDWLLYRASEGTVDLPEGSQQQLDWCRKSGWHEVARYADLKAAVKDPRRLFICFKSPKRGAQWPRHVWFVYLGETYEAAGGSFKKVGRRPWTHFLGTPVSGVFEVPLILDTDSDSD